MTPKEKAIELVNKSIIILLMNGGKDKKDIRKI